jgi:hypothetical protein
MRCHDYGHDITQGIDMRRILLMVLLLAIPAVAKDESYPGCALRRDFDLQTAATSGPVLTKARLIFVGADTTLFKSSISIDGKLVSGTGRREYAEIDIEPGEHVICISFMRAKSAPALLKLSAEAGKTYGYQQEFTATGLEGARAQLIQLVPLDEFHLGVAIQHAKRAVSLRQ